MSTLGSLFAKLGSVADLFFDVPEVSRHITFNRTFGGTRLPHLENGIFLNDIHFQDINAPGLIVNSMPVLFFTTAHRGLPKFTIRVNSTRVFARDFTRSDTGGSWHVFIPPGALMRENNEVVLGVSGADQDETEVIIGDMLILYKSNELTIRRPLVIAPTPT